MHELRSHPRRLQTPTSGVHDTSMSHRRSTILHHLCSLALIYSRGVHGSPFRFGIELTDTSLDEFWGNITHAPTDSVLSHLQNAVPFWFDMGTPQITVQIGTPPQQVPLLLDTGSHITWFMSMGATPFNPGASTTWEPLDRSVRVQYLDRSGCDLSIGRDYSLISGFKGYFPVGSGQNCTHFNDFKGGIMGLSTNSALLQAIVKLGRSINVFSFTFRDDDTGEGENLFQLGGYAGLDPREIIWSPHTPETDPYWNWYWVNVPYFQSRGKKLTAGGNASFISVIDTGCTLSAIPNEVWKDIYLDEPRTIAAGENEWNLPYMMDLSGLPSYGYPAVTMNVDGQEWMLELASRNKTMVPPQFSLGEFKSGRNYRMAAAESWDQIMNGTLPADIKVGIDFEREMILGSSFWSGLKGMVFDFGPGSKRVGLVPRGRWVNKNGMLNPFFTPGNDEREDTVAGSGKEEVSLGTQTTISWLLIAVGCFVALRYNN